MGPKSYVLFPLPHKVSYELYPHFQADLKKIPNFFAIRDPFLEALNFYICNIISM